MTEREWKERIAEQEARAEKFQQLHAGGVIEHELHRAAEEAGAFNPSQIVTFLKGKSRLVEAGGKEIVRIVTTGDDGMEVHHSPAQAVWHMKQDKDNHNLFKETMAKKPSLAPPFAQPKLDFKNMSQEKYRRIRSEHPEWLGLDPLPNRR
jgi:hypothetical protein